MQTQIAEKPETLEVVHHHSPNPSNPTSKVDFLVLKIASRCNLNCTYCYMYNLGDKTYLQQPKFMSEAVIDTMLTRVIEHCEKHHLTAFAFGFHGGEPLLAGKAFFINFVNKTNTLFEKHGLTANYFIQTNGVLLTRSIGKLFNELKIQIGVSLDGTEEINDTFRVDHKGKGTYQRVVAGINKLEDNKHPVTGKIRVGLLNVMNLNCDPVALYYHYSNVVNVESFDLLFPLANYQVAPYVPAKGPFSKSLTPYADWMLIMFHLWFNDKSQARPHIRLFDMLIKQVLGASASLDSIGNKDNGLLVIETDGGIEPSDVLKSCGNGITKQNLNIKTNALDDALDKELVATYVHNGQYLSETCKRCPIVEMCGGGYMPHRYSKVNGFDNPSIYCKDLVKLISEIQSTVVDNLPREILDLYPLEKLNYTEIINEIYAQSYAS